MSLPRLAATALIALSLAGSAGSALAGSAAPTGLHGFLFRVDEPARSSFPRTPAFAWNLVPGAAHYQFQLSTSNAFSDNAIVWEDDSLNSPVAAPTLTLPWITGSPHSLYARVRAVLQNGDITPWSSDFGFDMLPPPPPTPLPAAPGLLRWTPVEGADSYEIWLIEANKHEIVRTNVLDEREYYTFHQTSAWIGSVHWRVRALRADVSDRLNGIPVTHYGAWSPTYTSTNPSVTGGPIKLGPTISDVITTGSPTDPAHRLMPAFTWTGNETADGRPADLFRVEVFTDRECLNRVFTGPVVGSPAYAPRPHGPLALPTGDTTAARNSYLGDGPEPPATTYDGSSVKPNEMLPPASPTLTLPSDSSSSTSTGGSSGTSTGSTSAGSTSGGSSTSGGNSSAQLNIDLGTSDAGAPVDLWDTNWPQGGYYWTVIPVAAEVPGQLVTSVATPGGISGVTSLPVTSSAGFSVGDSVKIGGSGNSETAVIIGVSPGTLTFATGLKNGHGVGEPVVRAAGGGTIRYHDLELPQDVCKTAAENGPGRVARFGKSSEPALTSAGDAFASGISPAGKLVAATNLTPSFYGDPVVSWTPALGASDYEIQWSKQQTPFVPQPDTTGATGAMTAATSYVLSLPPGTWYYRVRGFDFLLPTGAQQMSWSDPAKVVIKGPTYAVVDSTATRSTKSSSTRVYNTGGFSLALPRSWKRVALKDSTALFLARTAKATAGMRSTVNVESGTGRGSRSYAVWAKDLAKQAKSIASGKVATGVVNESAGKVVALRYPMRLKNGTRVAVYQWVFENGKQAYVLTGVAPLKVAGTFAKVFAAVARSFSVS